MVGRWLMQQGCGLKGDRARDTGTTYWILSCGIPLRALYPFRPAPIQRRARFCGPRAPQKCLQCNIRWAMRRKTRFFIGETTAFRALFLALGYATQETAAARR